MRGTRPAAARLGTILLLLVPLAVSSTPPLPPPVVRFSVSGSLVRTGGGSLQDYAVTLLFARKPCLSEWRRFYDQSAIALTREDGRFSLTGSANYYASVCSLVVAVVYPDTMLLGTPFDEGEPAYTEEEYYTYEEEGFLCDDTKTGSYVTSYVHYRDDVLVTIP